ncbi:chlorhexidine efflux transporter (plasmid) [Salipiger sp. H15]|uniref:Chlorhexidine efflux transporter n=1 Tax=Alloyangia sp. H15 TaxID=3029062 RepID=A0AAU8AUW9_9RHOB
MLLVSPAYAAIFGAALDESFLIMAAIAVISLVWCPVYNTIFDRIELRRTGRVASDRPHRWRLVHAISYEVAVVVVEVPVIMTLGDHGLGEALALDLGLGAFYAGYAYLFHLGFDRLRPVAPAGMAVG